MRYMILIYGDEAAESKRSLAEQEADMVAYAEFTRIIEEQGTRLVGDALHPTSSATTVRKRAGKVLTTDGPFAETKEQLGGFYMVQCGNLDEAIGIAAKVPGALTGSIEIRPIVEWG